MINNIINEVETARCVLRVFQEKYITSRYVSWLNDKDIVRFSQQRLYNHTIKTCKLFLEQQREQKNIFFAIFFKKKSKHIGNFLIYLNKIENSADLTILIGEKKFWGQGLATEIWKEFIKILSKNKIRKITSGTSENNLGMQRVLKKTMNLEYIIPKKIKFGNKFIDSYHYAYYP